MAKCKRCKKREAFWAMQYVASDRPTFTRPGNHYRGFKVVKVCDPCRIKIQAEDTKDIKY
ncbi:MAG: hypothetical protein ACXADB_11580 [Candidatus Hermodarchaeia archaeon]|jgi:hypothetical protein